jgi:hypothetical protein
MTSSSDSEEPTDDCRLPSCDKEVPSPTIELSPTPSKAYIEVFKTSSDRNVSPVSVSIASLLRVKKGGIFVALELEDNFYLYVLVELKCYLVWQIT